MLFDKLCGLAERHLPHDAPRPRTGGPVPFPRPSSRIPGPASGTNRLRPGQRTLSPTLPHRGPGGRRQRVHFDGYRERSVRPGRQAVLRGYDIGEQRS